MAKRKPQDAVVTNVARLRAEVRLVAKAVIQLARRMDKFERNNVLKVVSVGPKRK